MSRSQATILTNMCLIEDDHGNIVMQIRDPQRYSWSGAALPGGHIEAHEGLVESVIREVKEETGATATIIQYVGKSQYSFTVPGDTVEKEVHWYLMIADNYHSKPQREEYFVDSGYYKFHEIYHLLRFSNEKHIVEQAYQEYLEMRSEGIWAKQQKYF